MRILLVGGGKMGGALLTGWLSADPPLGHISLLDPHIDEGKAAHFRALGVTIHPAHHDVQDVLVLAVKPQVFSHMASTLSPWVGSKTLILSIMAGIKMATLSAHFPQASTFVRAMPNLPASVGEGVTGIFFHEATPMSQGKKGMVKELLHVLGHAEWLETETQIDALTAISGSGPAYVFLFTEYLAQAGMALGLPPDLSNRLARHTVQGASALLSIESQISPTQLREQVTSPQGTTQAALDVLMQEGEKGLSFLLHQATQAAYKRAQELGS